MILLFTIQSKILLTVLAVSTTTTNVNYNLLSFFVGYVFADNTPEIFDNSIAKNTTRIAVNYLYAKW